MDIDQLRYFVTAAETLKDVKAAMKINYFDDEELIKGQSKKFSD